MSYFLPPKVNIPLDYTPRIPPQQQGPQHHPQQRRQSLPLPCSPPTRSEPTAQQDSRQSPSWGGWVRDMLPSRRPERGGTVRNHGYWDRIESTGQQLGPRRRRRLPDSRRSGWSGTDDSDRIVRWNTAEELSEIHPPSRSPQRRVVTTQPPNEPQQDSSGQDLSVENIGGTLRGPTTSNSKLDKANAPAAPQRSTSPAIRRLSEAQRVVDEQKQKRRQRRHLKASGDYLGVQGANPDTGLLDVMTPTDSDKSSLTHEVQPTVESAAGEAGAVGMPSNEASQALKDDANLKRQELEVELKKMLKLQQEKKILENISKEVNWRRRTKQWSSAQEPNLSPIAQSQISDTCASRKQSEHKTARATEHMGGGSLINLGTSESPSTGFEGFSPQGLEEDDMSDSCSTIVKTPHRQSLADLSPAALELFENGISFDNSDDSHARSSDATADPSPRSPKSAAGYEDTTVTNDHSLTPRKSRPEQLPVLQITTPGKTTANLESSPPPGKGQAFLDMRSRQTMDPGGQVSNAASSIASSPNPRGRDQAATAAHCSLDPIVKKGSVTQHGDANRCLSTHQDSALDLMTIQDSTDPQESMPPNPNRPLSRFQIRARIRGFRKAGRKKRKENKEIIRHSGELTRETLPSRKDARECQYSQGVNQSQPGLDLGDPPTKPIETALTKSKIQKDMTMLSKQIANLECPKPGAFPQIPKQWQTDHGWANGVWGEGVLRDITSKGNEVKGETVCTPTTTTTGCDHQMSLSSLIQNNPGRTEEIHRPQRKRGLNRLIYNLPAATISQDSLSSCLTNLSLNTSPNSMPKEDDEAIAITSMKHLDHTKQRSKKLVTTSATTTDSTEVVADQSRSPPSRSTSTTCRDQTTAASIDQAPTMAQKDKKGVHGEENLIPPRTSSKWPMKKARAKVTAVSMNEVLRTKPMRSTKSINIIHALSPSVRVPGSYPAHLDAKDGTDDHSRSSPSEKISAPTTWSKEKLWGAIIEMIKVIICHGSAALSLYWEIVGPVFKYSSEYWERHGKQQATMMDLLATTLAVPAGILGLTALI